MKTFFEMTAEDLANLLAAMKPAPMIALQCGAPLSVQESANAAWAVLGKKMGFDPMTVCPTGRGDRHFSAEPVVVGQVKKPHVFRDGNEWCAVMPGFVDLAKSKAGFGLTPAQAIAALKAVL